MSQLAKAVRAVANNQFKAVDKKLYSPLFNQIFDGKVDITEQNTPDLSEKMVGYRIGVKLEVSAYIADKLQSSSTDQEGLLETIKRSKRQIVEAVFGEFRPHFRRIEIAIQNQDYAEASRLVWEMERQMFEEFD